MQAIAEDLEALVKENQMIGHQLVAITAERERWQADMGAIAERAQRGETLARCRDSEASQLRREHEVTMNTLQYICIASWTCRDNACMCFRQTVHETVCKKD